MHDGINLTERNRVLMKISDMIDSVRINKHPLRSIPARASKVQQTRCERRKIRECLRLGDWMAEA
jgi:hypothetical protein